MIIRNKVILILTEHAKEKMVLLDIDESDIELAIIRGAKIKQTDGLLACYTYYCVAYKKIREKVYKVKTVYIETRR